MADKDGNKTGGRVKGTPNKKNMEIIALAEEMGCNPAKILMMFAMGDHKGLDLPEYVTKSAGKGIVIEELAISPDMRASAASDLMPYLYGKRKPVDSEGNDKSSALEDIVNEIDEARSRRSQKA